MMKQRIHYFTRTRRGSALSRIARPNALALNLVLGLLFATFSVGAQDWTRFRGPNGDGVAVGNTRSIPTDWSDSNVRWTTDLPGRGHSSPVLWKDKIFLSSAEKEQGIHKNLCISSKDGKILWSRESDFSAYSIHGFNSFASTTPVVDEKQVYFFESTPAGQEMKAYDHQGQLQWSRKFKVKISEHGNGVSPILFGSTVILSNDQEEGCFLIALDTQTGETVWKTEREGSKASFATPCVYQPEGSEPQLVFVSMAHGICGVDPKTGKTLWEAKDLFNLRTVSSPVIAGDLVIGTCGSGGGGNYLVAVKPSLQDGKVSVTTEFRIRRSAPYVPTPIYKDHRLYLWSDGGIVSCIDTQTGETLWSERTGGRYFGSPILLDDRLLCVSDTGEAVWVATGDEFKILGRKTLPEASNATPAFDNGRLFIRTESSLICLSAVDSLIVQ